MRSRNNISFSLWLVVCAFTLIAILIVVLSTSGYGFGLTTVSGDYFAAARSFASGKGFLQQDGSPFVFYPPLLPILLSLFIMTGLGIEHGILVINLFAFAAVVFICARWLLGKLESLPLSILGVIAILFGMPLISVAVFAWSELLFSLLALLFLFEMEKFLRTASPRSFYFASGYVALACLTRYIGASLIFTGVILLLLRKANTLRQKLIETSVFVLICALPLLVWIIRNYLAYGTLAGERGPSSYSLMQNAHLLLAVASAWFLPERIPAVVSICALLLLLAFVFFIFGLRFRGDREEFKSVFPLLVFVGVYACAQIASESVVALDRLNTRYLMPIYVPLILLIIAAADSIPRIAEKRAWRRTAYRVTVVLASLWALYLMRGAAKNVNHYRTAGAGGYSSVAWRNSEIIDNLKAKPLEGKLYSNENYAVYMLTGLPTGLSPRKYLFNSPKTSPDDLEQFTKLVAGGGRIYMIWFKNVDRPYLFDLESLMHRFEMDTVAVCDDGAIYKVKRAGGAGSR